MKIYLSFTKKCNYQDIYELQAALVKPNPVFINIVANGTKYYLGEVAGNPAFVYIFLTATSGGVNGYTTVKIDTSRLNDSVNICILEDDSFTTKSEKNIALLINENIPQEFEEVNNAIAELDTYNLDELRAIKLLKKIIIDATHPMIP